jgi:predicted pyridoxine 5'-phosphate oxidase superfamily flavin-nucleotide-binding protein
MAVFTDAERAFLDGQRIARLATADLDGTPDVSAVGFQIEVTPSCPAGSI